MKDSKTVFRCTEFPWVKEKTYPKFIDNLGSALKMFASPAPNIDTDH